MPRQSIKVIKVPRRSPVSNYPQNFPNMPRLYLELIENKKKVKQDLINKEYVPDETIQANSAGPPQYSNIQPSVSTSRDNTSREDYRHTDDEIDRAKLGEMRRRDLPLSPTDTDVSDDDLSSYSRGTGSISSDSSDDSSLSSDSSVGTSDGSSLTIDESFSSGSDDELSTRLKELLNDGDDMSLARSRSRDNTQDKYSRHRDRNGYSISHGIDGPTAAPSLAQLQAQGGYVPKQELRDLNYQPANEQQEEDSKREILFKFDLLKKSYPLSTIPEYSIHTDLVTLQKSYDECVRRLSLDSSVESYKTYLVYGFMGCEFVFGNFLGFDMQGFTQQQIISMHSYEKLLIELGEKSYVPSGSKWPIELRLLFMIIMNAAFCIVSKMMMKKTGANLMGMINNMNTPNPSSSSAPQPRKRKMKGPNIDINQIPDMSDLDDNGQGSDN